MSDEDLSQLRKQIDETDHKITELLDHRAQLAKQVGIKKAGGVVYRPAREAQVIDGVLKASDGSLPPEALAAIYREIIGACRNLQQPLSVAFLGPEGTYSEEAAQLVGGRTAKYVAMASIDNAVQAAERGEATIAVVPVENSSEGAVNRTLDLLLKTSLLICGEVQLPIHHQLLSNADSLTEITEIVAHPQALAQCRSWLARHVPHAKRTAVSSNGAAAQMAVAHKHYAAIASKRAADLYALNVLAENIEDDSSNTTRFLVLGSEPTQATGADKTSLVWSTPDRPGALVELLNILSDNKVNMIKLESRPAPSGLWEYVFYVDIDGHTDDEQVAKAIHELKAKASSVKNLGSYPKAERSNES